MVSSGEMRHCQFHTQAVGLVRLNSGVDCHLWDHWHIIEEKGISISNHYMKFESEKNTTSHIISLTDRFNILVEKYRQPIRFSSLRL